MRHTFQWSGDEPEHNSYTSFDTISSVQRDVVSVNMADNDGNDTDLHCRMQAQEEPIKNQQIALASIQRLLGQIILRQSNTAVKAIIIMMTTTTIILMRRRMAMMSNHLYLPQMGLL